ncbi:unnamed protein product [Rotaria socialis]|nr:unnamed protein product [Rotaria socialis]
MTPRRRSLEVTCDQIDQPDQLVKNLQVVASSSVNKLHLICEPGQTNVSMTSNYPVNSGLLLRHLQSMTFDFKPASIKSPDRIMIVKQILDASSNLSHLVKNWKDFHRIYPEPKQYFNVRRLTQLAPHLCCFETSGANIMPDKNLVHVVLKIIHRFHQRIKLVINEDSLYRSEQNVKNIFKESLITAGHN